MFSVNNFYDIFNSHFCGAEKNNSLWLFTPHGSKDWRDIDRHTYISSGDNYGAIIMHDQEPFFVESLDKFKNDLIAKLDYANTWYQYRLDTVNFDYAKNVRPEQLLSYYIRSTEIPIICHSEKNSSDIQYLVDNNYIACYYWWHGMVARDWYRHWERHAQLEVYNKSDAKHRFLFYCRDTSGTRQYRTEIANEIDSYSVLGSRNGACASLSATIDVDDANNSAIHIVAETLFDVDKIYLTEKVFKPIVMSQPFIVFAAANSLQYLRDYGFKTFNTVFDESYDTIVNHSERKRLVLDLIARIQHMSLSEFNALYEQCLPIITHNRQHFYSREFQDMLWDELTDNMRVALDTQQSLRDKFPGGTDLYHYNQMIEQGIQLNSEQIRYINLAITRGLTTKNRVLQLYPAFSAFIA